MKRVAFDATALAMLLDEAAPGDAVERRALVALVGIAIERLAPAPAVAEILVYYDVEEQVKIAHALRRSFKITPMGIGAAMEVGRLGVVPSAARNSTRQGTKWDTAIVGTASRAQVDAFCTLDGAQARMARRLMPGALTGLPSELMASLV